MPGTKGKSGGQREGAGRPPLPEGQKHPRPVYRRLPMAEPRGEDQEAAMAWWESLTPRQRTCEIKAVWDLYANPR